jgi:hypothetical protein
MQTAVQQLLQVLAGLVYRQRWRLPQQHKRARMQQRQQLVVVAAVSGSRC